jgi:hypothetical protein
MIQIGCHVSTRLTIAISPVYKHEEEEDEEEDKEEDDEEAKEEGRGEDGSLACG